MENVNMNSPQSASMNQVDAPNPVPQILVCGARGVGKTSLIRAVTYGGVVPDDAIPGAPDVPSPTAVYTTPIANFIDAEIAPDSTPDFSTALAAVSTELAAQPGGRALKPEFAATWYCIAANAPEVSSADARLIASLSESALVVVTCSELLEQEQIPLLMNSLLDLIPQERIVFVSADTKRGLESLMTQTRKLCQAAVSGTPETAAPFLAAWDKYYFNLRWGWRHVMSTTAYEYINWGAGRAAAIALMPLPLADVAPLMANEVYMIYKLAGVYGVAINQTVVSMLLGCAGGSLVGKVGASFLPFLKVPIAAATTYGVGVAVKAYFESGQTLSLTELAEYFCAGKRQGEHMNWDSKNSN